MFDADGLLGWPLPPLAPDRAKNSGMHTAPPVRNFPETARRILELGSQVAAFDCDGTVWSIDAGLGFFEWEIERQLLDPVTAATARMRLKAYKAGAIDEDTFNGYLAALHVGLPVRHIEQAAAEYVRGALPAAMFRQMADLMAQLTRSGCQIWLVSSTNQWVIEAAASLVGVPRERVLAAAAVEVSGLATDRLIRVPSGLGKCLALQAAVGRAPDLAFGNSRWDADMLDFAAHAFAIHPTPELQSIASAKAWPVLLPA